MPNSAIVNCGSDKVVLVSCVQRFSTPLVPSLSKDEPDLLVVRQAHHERDIHRNVGRITLVPECVLQLDEQLIRFELPAIEDVPHVVVVDDKQIGDRLERPPEPRVDAD